MYFILTIKIVQFVFKVEDKLDKISSV